MTDEATTTWRCTVCGYIHHGAEPPDECPVCGAPREEFEPYEEAAPAPSAAPGPAGAGVMRWRCLNCNYIHEGPEPPDECPVCGAPKDRFEPVAEESTVGAGAGEVGRVVVLGAGIAGVSAVESLRRAAPDAEIVLVSKERGLPYYRLNLTRFLAGDVTEDMLPIHPADWYRANKVELRAGVEVDELSLDAKVVKLRGGEELPFDRLILASGAHPFVPPFPGAQREGVTALRTDGDVREVLAALEHRLRCVVIGGGLLGLETAGALAKRGADVTLLESHEWLMPRQLNRRAGELLADYVEGAGIRLRRTARTKELLGDERVAGVLLEDGDTVPADLVVIATGVRPNSYLARRAGLEVDKGVVVDNRLVTSAPDVLAAGDVAEHRGVVYGSWHASQYQGSIAGMTAAGAFVEFGGIPRSNTLKVLGLDVFSLGRFGPEDGSFQTIEDEVDGNYRRFVFHDGRMVGAVLVGDASMSSALKKAVEGGADFSGLLAASPTTADVVEHAKESAG